MSTPSPVAKQAAKAEIENTCSNDTQPLGYFVQQAIDTAKAMSETRYGELREELEICKQGYKNELAATNEAWKQLAHQQPSATTPDVEKIARELWAESDGVELDTIRSYLAQVREPLVAVIQDALGCINFEYTTTSLGRIKEILSAALTGTEEKR